MVILEKPIEYQSYVAVWLKIIQYLNSSVK